MAALSSKLRSVRFHATDLDLGIAFWCPGCKCAHTVRTSGDRTPCWQWDGNVDRPTVSPSVLVRAPFPPEDGGPHVCHLFLQRGNLVFLGDCTHHLKGLTVALPDLPESSTWTVHDDG